MRQQRFVAEYIRDPNATQAAIRAGYSARTAHVQGPRLLGYAEIKALIQQQREQIAEKTEIDRDWVIARLKEVVEEDNAHGSVRTQALDKIARIVGAYEQDNSQRGKVVVEVRKRVIDKEDTA